ncbi:E3 ubiquitin-protein ligase MIB2 isoform X10 [Octopus vulgaris]|uniref:E3 ubiquitin-protein ligase MIB2 isoform X10 n=1 Tax=Octopus vulgaris TaxID=6645 RepID=A0AA36HHH3_OCTVU|nr:E3 ubiquitin-protein ligase MIB2 isoform X10 [Octopus vulgaris]
MREKKGRRQERREKIKINKPIDGFGRTPLMIACERGADRRIIDILIDAGSQIGAKDSNGCTALHCAVTSHRLQAVELLLSRGSNVNETDIFGNTPLHLAARSSPEWIDGVKELMKHSAVEVNPRNEDGQTPLHWACWRGHLHSVDLLLGHNGIDASVVNNKGDTPLHVAVRGCLWCRNKTATTKVHPCGHLVICKGCSNVPLQQCLKCLKPVITGRGRVASPKFADKGVQTDLQLLEPTSEQSGFQKLDERYLLKLACQLGGNWWKVGIFLGIKSIQLGIIRHDFSGNVQEQSFQMLLYWSTHCDPQEVTVDTLRAALAETECLTALESLSLLEE